MSLENPTAAELDRAIKAERAYTAAMDEGKTSEEALEIARQTVRKVAEQQFLRSVGIET